MNVIYRYMNVRGVNLGIIRQGDILRRIAKIKHYSERNSDLRWGGGGGGGGHLDKKWEP